jgi:hypothetical protein
MAKPRASACIPRNAWFLIIGFSLGFGFGSMAFTARRR